MARAAAAAGIPFDRSRRRRRSRSRRSRRPRRTRRAGSSSMSSRDLGVTPFARRTGRGGRVRRDRPDRRPAGARLPRPRSAVRLRAPAARQLRRDRRRPTAATVGDWLVRADRPPQDDPDLGRPRARSGRWSSLPLVLKGILTAEDAQLAVEHGVDGIVVSNHGARQLDRVPASVDVLAEIVDAVGGRTEVWVDGGVRRGLDIAIARRARGARRAARPADVLGAGRRRAGRVSSERSPSCARSSRSRSGAARHADARTTSRRDHVVAPGPDRQLIGLRTATTATPARHRPPGPPGVRWNSRREASVPSTSPLTHLKERFPCSTTPGCST